MATRTDAPVEPRLPLTRDRVLRAAVELADEGGIEAVSMRKVGQELGVEAMSLYNHVSNKEDMLDGMVDLVVSEIEASPGGADWKAAMRNQVMVAREVMMRHGWAPAIIETRTNMSIPTLKYFDSIVGILRDGGFSLDLVHHALHAMGSRVLGFSQELFDDSDALEQSPEIAALMLQQMTEEYPNISAMLTEITHENESVVGQGCDDNIEFVFALDLILDGLERLRDSA
jgi:AcrR family transcriptional regulator